MGDQPGDGRAFNLWTEDLDSDRDRVSLVKRIPWALR